MPSSELTEWMAFERLEPFGEPRADYRAALISSVVANFSKNRGQRRFKLSDFMPRFIRERKRQTGEQMFAILSKHAKAHNSIRNRNRA